MEEANIYYCSNKSALNSSRSQSLSFLNYIDKYVFVSILTNKYDISYNGCSNETDHAGCITSIDFFFLEVKKI